MDSLHWFFDFSVLFRIALAMILGGLVGLEREMRWRPAGLRTHMMVCLGATILIIGSEFSQRTLAPGAAMFAPDRLAAGIITGIGFLGAGAIIKEGNLVRGLTTAGSIWLVAGLGIIIGKQFYALAVGATLGALVVLVLFGYLEKWIPFPDQKDLAINLESPEWKTSKEGIREIFEKFRLKIGKKKMTVDHSKEEVEIRYAVQLKKGLDEEAVILEIAQVPGVKRVHW